MDNEKPNYFAIIPANIRYDKDLKPNEKLLYSEITALTNKEGYCWATNKYFADLYNKTPETISRWISHLASKNYLKIKYKKSNQRVLTIKSIGIDKNVKGGMTKMSNIIINNNNKYNIKENNKKKKSFLPSEKRKDLDLTNIYANEKRGN